MLVESTGVYLKRRQLKFFLLAFLRIKAIELNGEEIKEAFNPMSVTMRLNDEIDVGRGDMIVRENNSPEVTQDLEVIVTWMSEKPVSNKTKVFIKHTTNE